MLAILNWGWLLAKKEKQSLSTVENWLDIKSIYVDVKVITKNH